MGGVGVVLIRDKSGCFYVNLLVKGGPAHYSGRLQQGDILRFVDDLDLRERPHENPALQGPHGSTVKLGFERGFGADPFFVTLVRDEKCFPDQLALPPPGFDYPIMDPAKQEEKKPIPPPQDMPVRSSRASMPPSSPTGGTGDQYVDNYTYKSYTGSPVRASSPIPYDSYRQPPAASPLRASSPSQYDSYRQPPTGSPLRASSPSTIGTYRQPNLGSVIRASSPSPRETQRFYREIV